MEYDEELDEFICANSQRLVFPYETSKTSDNEYVSIKRKYSCFECAGRPAACPFQTICAKGKEQKTITISLENQRQRKCDVESVFGQIKHNQQFRHFSMRDLQKIRLNGGFFALHITLKKCRKQ
ncbi:transposase [Metabacillus sp. HB246100]